MSLKAHQINLFFGNNNINTLSDNIFNNHSKYHIQQLITKKNCTAQSKKRGKNGLVRTKKNPNPIKMENHKFYKTAYKKQTPVCGRYQASNSQFACQKSCAVTILTSKSRKFGIQGKGQSKSFTKCNFKVEAFNIYGSTKTTVTSRAQSERRW